MSWLKQIILTLLLLSCVACAYKIDQLERRVEQQEVVIAGYQDVYQNFDDMRRTQLVLIELYEGR